MKNEINEQKYDPAAVESISVANVPGLLDGLASFIALGATMKKEDYEKLIRAVIVAKFAPELERVEVLCAAAKERIAAVPAVILHLKERLAATVRMVPVPGPRAFLPLGLDRTCFFACLGVAVLVSIVDGINASLLAARELQSVLAGLSFLAPALFAPLLAKLALTRLPVRARYWAELWFGLLGFATAGFYIYQFVTTFTATPSDDQVADGGALPGMKYLYLATLALGFMVVYFLLAKAMSLIQRGPLEQANDEYVQIAQELAAAEQAKAQAEASLAAHQPRLNKVQKYVDCLVEVALSAAESKRAGAAALARARQAESQAAAAAAEQGWAMYEALLGGAGGRSTNGVSSVNYAKVPESSLAN